MYGVDCRAPGGKGYQGQEKGSTSESPPAVGTEPFGYQVFLSAPERIRTSDLRFRRPTLYPAELRARSLQQRVMVARQRSGRRCGAAAARPRRSRPVRSAIRAIELTRRSRPERRRRRPVASSTLFKEALRRERHDALEHLEVTILMDDDQRVLLRDRRDQEIRSGTR